MGAALIKKIAANFAGPRRQSKSDQFMNAANIEERATDRYGDAEVVRIAVELGRKIGGFAAEDELADAKYVDDLAEIVLSLAPHQALVLAFQEISNSRTRPSNNSSDSSARRRSKSGVGRRDRLGTGTGGQGA